MEQNNELRIAWDFVEHTGRSIFLTGKAGTGKTTFLKAVVEQSCKRSIVVTPDDERMLKPYYDTPYFFGSEVLGKFTQLPLRLAWAITIHKSQGLTFERAIIDASLSRRFLLQQMSQKTFTIADYLRQKQHSLLNAMDTDDPKRNGGKGSTKGRKKDRKK